VPQGTGDGERVAGERTLSNPFLLRANVSDFIELKRNWLEYKRLHGIK
jgi:hypothetical protein